MNVTAAVLNATRTEKTMASFAEAVAPAVSKESGSAEILWNGMFAEPVEKVNSWNGIITTGFGHSRKISVNGESYIHEGVDYIRTSGGEVFAANNGKVLFAGYTELGGNTIVIEHGYGLKSWYSHLSEIKVAVGDTVAKADVIGIAGSTGFTKQTGVHAGATVFDVPVSPYPYQDAEKEADRGVEIKIVK
jgi:murein DD-endopeptidase MepM/ murein hydrolase activator NlpD